MNVVLELSSNPLLEAIRPRSDDQRQFLVLQGYISSATPETVTVYPELDLRSFLEIPRGEIVWAEQAIPGQVSSPTKLVINAAAAVKRVTSSTVEAGFLSGMITSSCLATSAAGVSVKVEVENEAAGHGGTTCPGPVLSRPGARTGGTSNCKLTGVCISDGAVPEE
jgi:hypothetical protein